MCLNHLYRLNSALLEAFTGAFIRHFTTVFMVVCMCGDVI